MAYEVFSTVYDILMQNVDYPKRAEYLLSIFNRYDKKPTLLLDLACGTGGFATEMQSHGIDVIGVDASEDMLNVAMNRAPECLWLCQKAEELDLFGTVDGAICLMDSLNHITEYKDFCKAIKRTALFLEQGRLFVFDLNTEYKHKQILADNSFVIEQEGVFCTWQNSTEDNLTEIMLDFFLEAPDGSYIRQSDDFSERAYTQKEVERAVADAGLEIVAIFDDLSFKKPNDKSERVYYITRKA